ncbi:MAG TPA: GNAT family N-acetyltransferase [Solirubrobacterales bacterium]|nr:GNAT family N-acetyltransferase [Solirubrobacterales bacterium]
MRSKGDRLRIRRADLADLSIVSEIVDRAYGVYVKRIGMRPGPMDADYRGEIDRGVVWVAAEREAVLGLIVLVENPDHLLIENVAVDPAHQGEGVGRALLGFAEDSAREGGLDAIRLYTHEKMRENLALYARLGYREFERRDEGGFDRVFLSKNLSAAS